MIETVAVAYGLLLAALTIRHDRWLHFLGMLLGGFFFTSRGLAFLQIASAGRPDLMGAVAERALLTIVVISYHYLMLYVLTRKKA